jgi:hypothetical protein
MTRRLLWWHMRSLGRTGGVRRVETADRTAIKTLGYNKSLEIRKLAVALHFGVYNFVLQRHAAPGNQTQPLMILYDIYCLMSL